MSNLDNDGLVLDSAAGDLRIDSYSALAQTGTFRSAGAGAIAFDYGTFMLEPGAVIDGDVAVSGADVHLSEGHDARRSRPGTRSRTPRARSSARATSRSRAR